MLWNFLSEETPKTAEEVTKTLLSNRKIVDQDLFFSPPNPLDISVEELGIDSKMLQLAKDRILEAIEKKQKILVFGDYDADGVSATAILWKSLYELKADVLPFIPNREKHGYGLTDAALKELYEKPLPDLIITVDTGIVAHKAVDELVEKGIDVIITDHHQPEKDLPKALYVVHSTKICGAAVAWTLVREFGEELAKKNLDLVALATVTDLMVLKGNNRALVFHGLKEINKDKRKGLTTLKKIAGLENREITATHLGFVIGPRINAMGRLSSAMDALRLLCTNNQERALKLAGLIDNTNSDRQQLTRDLYQQARQQIAEQKDEHILVVHSSDFHEGIIGLIAGRLTEAYAKPSIVISTKGDVSKASARSVPGVNITEIIRTARKLLLEFGGHPMAAGFGFEHDNLSSVAQYFAEYGRENISPDLLQKRLDTECLLPMDLVDVELIESINKLAPFGQGNSVPVFAFKDIRVEDIKTMGSENQHLKLTLTDAGSNKKLTVLAWRKAQMAESLEIGALVNAAVVLEINEWRGKKTPQAVLKDLQLAEVF
jgi:single-stranded-DNA-specific exonuclease